MRLIMSLTISFVLAFFWVIPVQAATLEWSEDCESSTYTEYFLEEQYGTNYQTYWNELTSELTRSTTAHSGSYSMTYNPWVTGNPHAVVGSGNTNYGNTSNYDLSTVNGRYWYFRWYQRWESVQTYSGENKLLYINDGNYGDFLFTFKKLGPDDFHITVIRNDIETVDRYISNPWTNYSGGSLDDELWHKMEVFIDVGTTGDGNGNYWVEIDDIQLYEDTGLTFNATISSSPIHHLTGWPSNVSDATGSQYTWLDDLEIYTLSSETDIPGKTDTTAPTISGTPAIASDGQTVSIDFSETVDTSGYTSGDFDLDCSGSGDNIALSSPSGSGSSWVFTAAATVVQGETCNLDFNGAANSIEDIAGNDLASFSGFSVENFSEQGITTADGSTDSTTNGGDGGAEDQDGSTPTDADVHEETSSGGCSCRQASNRFPPGLPPASMFLFFLLITALMFVIQMQHAEKGDSTPIQQNKKTNPGSTNGENPGKPSST